jgi:hypothetical protein
MSSDFDWEPVPYFGDPYTHAIANAAPGSGLFEEFVAMAMRLELDRPDTFTAAADVGSVMAELDIGATALAARMHVPIPFIHAVAVGWHRLGLRGLALVAEALEVPIATFFVDADGATRLEVRRYLAFRYVGPSVTILGGL